MMETPHRIRFLTATAGRARDLRCLAFPNGIGYGSCAQARTAMILSFPRRSSSRRLAPVLAFAVLWDSLERAGSTDRKKLHGAKFTPAGENLLAGGLVFVVKDKEWVTVAPKEYAKTTAPYPKPKWGA
jgi:hypothetical protein